MLDRIRKLTEICDQLIAISNEKLPTGLSKTELTDKVRASTARLKALTRECNELFANEIDPKFNDAGTLTDAEEDAFFALAQKLSSFTVRMDTGMALKIYEALLKRARALGDKDKVLKYLYWCGITLFYNNSNRVAEFLVYFEEGAAYHTDYMNMQNRESRQYVHRCMGNTTMALFMLGDIEKARRSHEYVLSFWNKLMFLGKDADFPWFNYFISCTNHYRRQFTQKMHSLPKELTRNEIKSIYRISLLMNKLAQKVALADKSVRGTRYDLMLWEAQFVAGQISMALFCENVKNAQMSFPAGDYSENALYANIMMPCYLMFYAKVMLPDDAATADIIRSQKEHVTDYINAQPPGSDPGQIAGYLILFVRSASGILPADEHFSIVVDMTTSRHKIAYAHAAMVSKLTKRIVDAYLQRYPDHFVGLPQINTAADTLAKRGYILELAQKSGLCHDVGKLPFIRSQTMFARALTKDEIYLVRGHVQEGLTYFANVYSDETEVFRHVIHGHHVYYDGSAGYPSDFDISASPYRALIHAVTVADSIDAATDDIGKVYSRQKTLEAVIGEIEQGAGTRYSPFVAELLSDEELISDIEQIITRDRVDAYYEAYIRIGR